MTPVCACVCACWRSAYGCRSVVSVPLPQAACVSMHPIRPAAAGWDVNARVIICSNDGPGAYVRPLEFATRALTRAGSRAFSACGDVAFCSGRAKWSATNSTRFATKVACGVRPADPVSFGRPSRRFSPCGRNPAEARIELRGRRRVRSLTESQLSTPTRGFFALRNRLGVLGASTSFAL
jgi:hypothetical protein